MHKKLVRACQDYSANIVKLVKDPLSRENRKTAKTKLQRRLDEVVRRADEGMFRTMAQIKAKKRSIFWLKAV